MWCHVLQKVQKHDRRCFPSHTKSRKHSRRWFWAITDVVKLLPEPRAFLIWRNLLFVARNNALLFLKKRKKKNKSIWMYCWQHFYRQIECESRIKAIDMWKDMCLFYYSEIEDKKETTKLNDLHMSNRRVCACVCFVVISFFFFLF